MIIITKKIKKIDLLKILRNRSITYLILDEEVLNAVKVQDAIRERYKVDKTGIQLIL